MERIEAERHVDEILAIAAFQMRLGTPEDLVILALREEFVDALVVEGDVEELRAENEELASEVRSLEKEVRELKRELDDK